MAGSNWQSVAALGARLALAGALGDPPAASEETIFNTVYTLLGDIAVLVGRSRQIPFDRYSPQSQPANTGNLQPTERNGTGRKSSGR